MAFRLAHIAIQDRKMVIAVVKVGFKSITITVMNAFARGSMTGGKREKINILIISNPSKQ